MGEIKLSNGKINAVIDYHGAELRALSKNGKDYMWNADPKYWGRVSPVLFPFVGAVNDGHYLYKGQKYPMGQHGFARDMDFELLDQNDTEVQFVLNSNEETRKLYPLDFKLMIGYELIDDGIKVLWEVENIGEENLEFSIGAHPAFLCNLNESSIVIKKDGEGLSEFTNSVFGKGLLTHDKKNITLDKGVMKLNEHSFDNDAYVIEENQTDEVEILDKDGKHVLSVKYSSPLVGIWSPPGKNAPFLCIEPWYGRADKEGYIGEINNREWNNTLAPLERFKAEYCIIL